MTVCAPISGAVYEKTSKLAKTVFAFLFYLKYDLQARVENRNEVDTRIIISQRSSNKIRFCGKFCVFCVLVFLVLTLSTTLLSFKMSKKAHNSVVFLRMHQLKEVKHGQYSNLRGFKEKLGIPDSREQCLLGRGYVNIAQNRCYHLRYSHRLPYLVTEFEFCGKRSLAHFYPVNPAEVLAMYRVLKHFTGRRNPPEIELAYNLNVVEDDMFLYVSLDGKKYLDDKSPIWSETVVGKEAACQYGKNVYDCERTYGKRRSLFVCFHDI